jgi:hypothetical protein
MLRARAVGVLASLAVGAPACSFIFVEPLPATHHRGDRTECTSSLTSPIVDSAFALGYVGTAAYIGTRDNISNKAPAVALALVDAAVTLSSAIYGYVETGECRAAQQDAEAALPLRGLGTTPFTDYPPAAPAAPTPAAPAAPTRAAPAAPTPAQAAPNLAPPATLAPGETPRM